MSVFIKTEPLDIHEDDFVGQIIAEAEAFEELSPVEQVKLARMSDVALMGRKWCAYENCEICIEANSRSRYCDNCFRYYIGPALMRENDEKHELYYSTLDKIDKLVKKKNDMERVIEDLHTKAQAYGIDYHETANKNRIPLMSQPRKRILEEYSGQEFHPANYFNNNN